MPCGRCASTVAREGRGKSTFSLRRAFPTFVGLFVLASLATTVFALPTAVTAPLKTLSKFLIVMAMSAIGLNTDIVKLVRTAASPSRWGPAVGSPSPA